MSSPVGDSIVTKRVYKNYPISLLHKATRIDLVELDMLFFDVIWGWIGCMLVFLPLIVGLGY